MPQLVLEVLNSVQLVEVSKIDSIASTIISVITDDLEYPVELTLSSVIADIYMDSLDYGLLKAILEGIYNITIDDTIYLDSSIRISDLANHIQNKIYDKSNS